MIHFFYVTSRFKLIMYARPLWGPILLWSCKYYFMQRKCQRMTIKILNVYFITHAKVEMHMVVNSVTTLLYAYVLLKYAEVRNCIVVRKFSSFYLMQCLIRSLYWNRQAIPCLIVYKKMIKAISYTIQTTLF